MEKKAIQHNNYLLTSVFCIGMFLGGQTYAQVLNAPELVSPANNAVDQPKTITFNWNASALAASYQLQVSSSADFSSLVANTGNLLSTSETLTVPDNGTTYYWRVRAATVLLTSGWSETRMFQTIPSPPPSPVPVTPPGNAVDQPASVLFTWNPSTGASHYRFQLATVPDFSSLTRDAQPLTGTSYRAEPLSPGTTYYWRTSASNAGGTSSWSEPSSFNTAQEGPLSPTLSSPSNGSVNQPTTLTVAWNASSGATSYQVQVSTSANFASTVVDRSNITSTSTQIGPLANNAVHYWRVRAYTLAVASDWSAAWSFTTIVATPAAPTLALPSNGATNVSTSPALSWNTASGANAYQLQVSTTSTFSSLVVDQNAMNATTFSATGLSNSTTYYWRVRGSNAGGTSAWSSVWNFATTPAAPVSPSLAVPVNGAADQPTAVSLQWNASQSAAAYRLQVSLSSTFSSTILDQSGITSTTKALSGLGNNTTYYWRVNASNSGGTSNWSSVWNFKTIVAVPGAPTLSAPANNAVDIQTNPPLSWNTASGGATFHLQVSTRADFASIVTEQSGLTAPSQQISGLANSTPYYWRVRGSNAGGTGPWSAVWNFRTAPVPPLVVTLASPGNNSVNISTSPVFQWKASNGAALYNIQVAANAGFSPFIINESTAGISYSASGLSNNTTYYWRVRGSNAGGTSDWSTVWTLKTIPSPPAAPTAASPTNGAANQPTKPTLNWTASPEATAYRLQLAESAAFSSRLVDDSTLTGTSKEVGPLQTGTTYYWRTNAKNAGGTSPWAGTASFTTTNAEALPGPTLLSPSSGSVNQPTTLTVAWNSSAGALSYRLQASSTPDFRLLAVNDSGMTTTSKQIGPLSNSATYYWRVRAQYALTVSDWSSVWNFTTVPALPDVPTLASPANSAINISITPTLSWNLSEGATSYRLQVSTSSTFASTLVDRAGITQSSFTTGALSNNTAYYWRVNATNAGGTSAWSVVRQFTTLPPIPSPPVLAVPANNAGQQQTTLSLRWNAVKNASTYNLQVSTDSTFTTVPFNQPSVSDTSTSVQNLLHERKYYWRVNASNAGGTGPWSSVRNFTTVPQTPTAPTLAQPQNNSINQPTSPVLQWNAAPGASHYRVQVSTDAAFAAIIFDTSAVGGTNCQLRDLNISTTYYWRVYGSNAGGNGGWSSVWSFRTLPAAPSSAVLISPFNGAIDQPVTLQLKWKSSPAAENYWVQIAADPDFSPLTVNDSLANDTSLQISSLEKERAYWWRVSAGNAAGRSSWSAAWKFTTMPPEPSPPVPASPPNGASVDTTAVLLTWNESPRAESYWLQLAEDSIFSTALFNDSTLKDSSQEIQDLRRNAKYFWRVRAVNSGGASTWAPPNSFLTRTSDAQAGPLPVSPPNGSTNQPLSVTLSWEPVAAALSYQVQVSADQNFTTLIFDNSAANTNQQVGSLENSITYYWRVRATFLLFTGDWSQVWRFTTLPLAPDVPVLLSPADESTEEPAELNLIWALSPRAETYHLQLSPDSGFSARVIDNSLLADTVYQVSGLLSDTTFFWRVAAMNGGGKSGWSERWTFRTIRQRAPAPQPVFPPDNALVDSGSVIIAWNSFPGALSYSLQVCIGSEFGESIYNDSTIADTSRQVSNLQPGTTYYWRVRSNGSEDKSPWSSASYFTTRSADAQAGPGLTSPPNNSMDQPTTLTLSWNSDASASSYHLQVSDNQNFENPAFENLSISGTSQQVGPLNNNTVYFWRVRSQYFLITSDWSNVWAFTTIPSDVPSAPTLLAPANGAANQSISPPVQWQAVDEAVQYHLQVSKNSAFDTLLFNDTALTAISTTVGPLGVKTTYYWRVRAKNSVRWSPFSPAWSFATIQGSLPASITDPATDINATHVTLNARVNPNGLETIVRFQYGTTTAYGNAVDAVPLVINGDALRKVSNVLQGLAPNTTYHYLISAVNQVGSAEGGDQTFTTPLPQYPATWNLSASVPFPAYSRQADYQPTDYKIIGLPGAGNVKIDSLLGGAQHKDWEVFWDDGSGSESLMAYDGGAHFRLHNGRAFWLLKKGELKFNLTVPVSILDSLQEMHIPLHAGWNLITNPFLSNIAWSALQNVNGVSEKIYEFNNSFALADTFKPYVGYYFFNANNSPALRVPYASLYPPAQSKSQPSGKVLSKTSTGGWKIQIDLSTERGSDNTAWLGVFPQGTAGKTSPNYHKPKGFGTLPVVFFHRPEWDSSYGIFASDFRSQFGSVGTWPFTAKVPLRSPARLKFSGLAGNIPSGMEAYLIDMNALRAFNLKKDSSYTFVPPKVESEFRIVIGIEDSVRNILQSIQAPKAFALLNNYPNPFNPETTIPVEIPARSSIELKVYNILGQEIRKLFSGEMEPGRFWFVWDGKDESKRFVSTGVYFYRLKASQGASFVKKMVLAK